MPPPQAKTISVPVVYQPSILAVMLASPKNWPP